jgi:eukaryotic-like serine/threonine-protein kinase
MGAATRPDDLALPDRFAIHRKVGSGAFGNVYDVHDRERDMRVALKTLERMDAMSVYRFKREFRELSDIVHPNLVRLHELFCVEGRWFFTMDLVEGATLLEYLRRGAEISECELRCCVAQLVAGVGALHRAGKLHRDLKPLNVIVGREGRVVILDFGLVVDTTLDGASKDRAEIVGTPAYMAPEQAVGRPSTPASDWYSVGVMLFEAMTGALPFAGSAVHMMHQKQSSEPPDPGPQAPDGMGDLARLSVRLMAREPSKRPALEELDRLSHAWLPKPDSSSTGPRGDRISLVVAKQPAEFLVGRQEHLERMRAAFEQVVGGAGRMLRITGRSGMGKSALVQHYIEDLERSEQALVLKGRCYECETVPYKALDSMVDSLTRALLMLPQDELAGMAPSELGALVRLFPVLRRIAPFAEQAHDEAGERDPHELRRRGFAALRQLLRKLGDRSSLVVWIDDLQWGDVDSAGFLAGLIEPPEAPRLLLIASYRQEDAARSAFLETFLGAGRQERSSSPDGWDRDPARQQDIEVGPLLEHDAEHLASLLLGDHGLRISQPPAALAQESKGNPLFLLELVQHVKDVGQVAARETNGRVVRLDDVLADHVGRLPEGARRLLETVSLAARAIEIGVARRASGLVSEVRECLDALRMSRLVRTQGLRETDSIEPYHDRIRRVVSDSMEEGAAQQRHRAIGEALESFGCLDPELLAFHFLHGGVRDKAWTHLMAAADRASHALAFVRAAELYRSAQSVCAVGEEFGLRVKLADALANAGRGGEASETYLSALELSRGQDSLQLRRKAAESALRVGLIDHGLSLSREVLAEAGMKLPSTPLRALLMLLLLRAWLRVRGMGYRGRYAFDTELLSRIDVGWALAVGLSNSDVIRGSEVQTRTLLLALRAGEPVRIARSLAFEAALLVASGQKNQARAVKLLAAASTLAREIGQPYVVGWAAVGTSAVAYFGGHWSACLRQTDAALQSFGTCAGAGWERATARHYGVWSLAYLGEVSEMARRVHALLKEALERGDRYSATSLRTFLSNLAWLVDDDTDGAAEAIDEAMGSWSKSGFHVQHYYELYARVQLDLYTGRATEAWQRVTRTWPALQRSMLLRVQTVLLEALHLRARCCLARAASEPAGRAALLAEARSCAGRIARQASPWAQPTADLVFGAVAHLDGDDERARVLLDRAASGFQGVDMALFAAAARRCLGRLDAGDGAERLSADANAWMTAQGIRRPDRWTAMLAPGFESPT